MDNLELSEIEKKVLKALINGLPLVEKPYETIAKQLNLREEEVISTIKNLKEKKVIRRLGATLRHNLVGYQGNALVAWLVPEERIEEVGKYFAKKNYVSHCYVRKTYTDWPYNFYTMCHAKNKEDLIKLIEIAQRELKLTKYEILFTVKELTRKHAQYNME